RHLSHLQSSFFPPSFPLFATGFPSFSTISKAKSTTGALLTDVPTPKPSAPASERALTDLSSSPPETKILTSLNPLESSSQRTSLIISWNLPLRQLGVFNHTPYNDFPDPSAAMVT